MEGYRQAILSTEQKEDDIYDDLKCGILDMDIYKRKIDKLRNEKRQYEDLLEHGQVAITDAFYETSERILELAKNAESLWYSRSPQERVKTLKRVLSNQLLDGVTIRYELKKPYQILAKMSKSEDWCG